MRKGYIQTTKSVNKVMSVLTDPKLTKTRTHYMKAIEYFYNMKNPDYENTIKESVCALEASLIALFSRELPKILMLQLENYKAWTLCKLQHR